MRTQFTILLLTMSLASIAIAKDFNFGSADVQNNCKNVRLQVATRLNAFIGASRLPANSFSLSVGDVSRHKTGHKGSYSTCVARILSQNSALEIVERELAHHYGPERNFECARDVETASKDIQVLGSRIDFNQGWATNPYCQATEVLILKVRE